MKEDKNVIIKDCLLFGKYKFSGFQVKINRDFNVYTGDVSAIMTDAGCERMSHDEARDRYMADYGKEVML